MYWLILKTSTKHYDEPYYFGRGWGTSTFAMLYNEEEKKNTILSPDSEWVLFVEGKH